MDQKKHILVSGFLAAFIGLSGCGPKISKDTYVLAMSEMGCRLVQENTTAGEAVLKEKGITQADITEFRTKADKNKMMATAGEIASKVAACHGVK